MKGTINNPDGKFSTDGSRKLADVANAATSAASTAAETATTGVDLTTGFFNRRSAVGDPTVVDRNMIYTDEAEDAVLSSVEQRAKYTQVGEDGFRPAVRGELPPLRVPNLGVLEYSNSMGSRGSSSRRSSTRSIQAAAEQYRNQRVSYRQNKTPSHKGRHRRARTLLTDIGEDLRSNRLSDAFGFKDAYDFDKTFIEEETSSQEDGRTDSGSIDDDENYPHEGLPLLSDYSEDKRRSENKLKARKLLAKKNTWKKIKAFLNPTILVQGLFDWFVGSTLIVAIPLFLSALIIFYVFGNPPTPDYIPGNINVSWWFDFAGK